MNKITWTIFAVVTVSILGLLVFFSSNDKSNLDVSKIDVGAIQTANDQNGNIADHIFGKVDGKVTLIEYGDFQCPGCASEHIKIKAIIEEYKDQLQFVFRNFPLPATTHPNARIAAASAEAAGLQGKYWEMHNKIYESQSDWNSLTGNDRSEKFISYAKDFGLDTSKFKTDLSSVALSDKINYDHALGKKAKVEATPSFYLNGVSLESSIWSDDAKLKEAINTELKKAGIALPESAK